MGLIEQTKESITYENDTGLVKEEKTTNIINTNTNNQKDFLYVFTKSLGYLKNLTKSETHTLFGLFGKVTNDNKLYINKGMKQEISKQFDLNFQTVSNAIPSLKKKGILGSLERGVYVLNPQFFGKGSFQDMKKIKISQEFDFDNLTYKTIMEQEFKTEEEKLKMELEKSQEIIKQLQDNQPKETNLFNIVEENDNK